MISPENNYQLFIQESNENQSLLFRWEISEDENEDNLIYYISFDNEDFLIDSIETSDSEIEIPFSHFIDALLLNDLNSVTTLWDVSVTDSFEVVASNNGPFSLFIDIEGMLNIKNNNLIPDIYALYQNYPNPFNPVTTIKYNLPEDALVKVVIFDVMGRKVKTLMNEIQSSGYHSILWNSTNDMGEDISAGMYIYTILAGEYRSSKKMVLIK